MIRFLNYIKNYKRRKLRRKILLLCLEQEWENASKIFKMYKPEIHMKESFGLCYLDAKVSLMIENYKEAEKSLMILLLLYH
mgnify:FL=1|jgi:hypothetical protein